MWPPGSTTYGWLRNAAGRLVTSHEDALAGTMVRQESPGEAWR